MRGVVKVPCALYRGGTSRGLFFHEGVLPEEPEVRDRLLLGLMGSPDVRQIDGLGGATSHTSKVAVVAPSDHPEADVEYDFLQVAVDRPLVDRGSMCGNLLAAAGLFAVDEGLVPAVEPVTLVRVRNRNTGKFLWVHVPVRDGASVTQGDYRIAGVPRAGARIQIDFLDPVGSLAGALLPAGPALQEIEAGGQRYTASLMDAANPIVFAPMEAFDLSGTEPVAQLNADGDLLGRLEELRAQAARLMGLVSDASRARLESPASPRLCLVSEPAAYQALDGTPVASDEQEITCRMLSMQRFHQSLAVTAAVAVGVGVVTEGTLPQQIVGSPNAPARVRIGHPSGVMDVEVAGQVDEEGRFRGHVSVGRTARRLMDGYAYAPSQGFEPTVAPRS